ncbi:M23 family metallopeptidase [Synechococcus sp. CBW1002]|nr:M23 family metallopeptidase [Synechococcus sp. CBW1002]QPN68488.1 M23 family metallopeptidase [Synechococcus sp. CBW1006]
MVALLPLTAAGLAWGEAISPAEGGSAADLSAPVAPPPQLIAPPSAAAPEPATPPARVLPARPITPQSPNPQIRNPRPITALDPQPLRPDPQATPARAPSRFDASLDALVRQGVVTSAERDRVRSAGSIYPQGLPAHRQACSSGALSAQECRTGLVVRWRGRGPETQVAGLEQGGFARIGGDGQPLPPLTVPVSALLAGPDGSFSLAQVFRVTPRPAPIAGNGNRRLLFPLIGSAVTSSGFGWRLHPLLGNWLMHAGRDLAAPEGTPVVAALSGRVVSSGPAGGYGLAIEVEHDRPRRRSLYGHLSELYVKAGDQVRQGEVIGRVGSTGMSTGPHLHFELRLPQDGGWVAVDPGDLDPGGAAVGSDAIALLMGQLLQTLERPSAQAGPGSSASKAS